MEKQDPFVVELGYIKNDRIRKDAHFMIGQLPDYFFEIAASSTGKYHPSYTLGEGGLVRHTKAAVRIAYELLQDAVIGDKYTSDEKDLMIFALLIHDGVKSGREQSRYSKANHPLLVVELLEEVKAELHLSSEELDFLEKAIASHMGPWNKDYEGNEILPVPKSKYENFVHMCDYLASRKCILIPFNEENKIVC